MDAGAQVMVPADAGLDELRAAAAACTACHLHELGTQTVLGEGAATADLMLVGEQPGGVEDREGRPFVGPAGQLLDRAPAEAGVARERADVTNAVSTSRGPRAGRRIHDTPNERELRACVPWLRAEIEVVGPSLVVCLGATAAKALLGRDCRLTRHRGEIVEPLTGPPITATLHPSAVLRPPDRREALFQGLVDDLRLAARAA